MNQSRTNCCRRRAKTHAPEQCRTALTGHRLLKSLYLACVIACFAVGGNAPALSIDAPPECRVRDEYGFGCHAKYLAGLEEQIRSILEEVTAHNAVHRTPLEPIQSQSAWEDSRQARCGMAPSWNPRDVDESFDRIECYIDLAEKRFAELDALVHDPVA
ncbi:MAG: hypothetical protein IT494_06270 [Gammaproteobacteria bacterium]|nr:hypothetical protein [Gammaproteobacteria bacterium]